MQNKSTTIRSSKMKRIKLSTSINRRWTLRRVKWIINDFLHINIYGVFTILCSEIRFFPERQNAEQ